MHRLCLVLALVACTPAERSPTSTEQPPTPDPSALAVETDPEPTEPTESQVPHLQSFEATVHVDATPGGKRFQGVWLERDGGERWVAAYRPEGWLAPFDGVRVTVTGSRYAPQGQAIQAPHFRVETIAALDPLGGSTIVAVGAEQELSGSIALVSGEAGSKSEGETWMVFRSAGLSYTIVPARVETPAVGDARLLVRVVEQSPVMTRVAGPSVCIVRVLSDDESEDELKP